MKTKALFLNEDGFTLIETLVYLGLFAIIMTGVISVAFATFEGNGRLQTKNLIQEEGDFLLAKINYALTGATSVSQPVSGSPDNTLIFIKAGSTLTFNLSTGNLQLGGINLNNSNVSIVATPPSTSIFSHTCSSSPCGSAPLEFVTAGFTLQAKTPNGQTYSQDFQTTKYLRK